MPSKSESNALETNVIFQKLDSTKIQQETSKIKLKNENYKIELIFNEVAETL